MFNRILIILATGLLFIGVGVDRTLLAADEAVIVSVNDNGAPDTVLSSPNEDITPFLKANGYDKDRKPIIKKVIGYAEDSTPIINNEENEDLTSHCKH